MRISLFLCAIGPQKFIKNVNIPACQQCIYFSPDTYSSCAKFGEKDIVTNKINYDNAILCRQDENKCGEKGIFFEQDNIPNIYFKKYIFLTTFILIFTGTLSFITILEFLYR